MEGFSQARMEERERECVEGVSDTGESGSIDVIADDRIADSFIAPLESNRDDIGHDKV